MWMVMAQRRERSLFNRMTGINHHEWSITFIGDKWFDKREQAEYWASQVSLPYPVGSSGPCEYSWLYHELKERWEPKP